jgi:hypothetical protein
VQCGKSQSYAATGSHICPPMSWPASGSRLGSGNFTFTSTPSMGLLSRAQSPSLSMTLPVSRAPSPTASDVTGFSYPSKRIRLSRSGTYHSRHSSNIDTTSNPSAGWSKGEQALFETSLARLTASAGFPLQWVDNPEWHTFCERWIPNAKCPSRKVLTQRLLLVMVKARLEALGRPSRALVRPG